MNRSSDLGCNLNMLYLEDFLELIDQLPGELLEQLTEMRTLDLEVQNKLDVNGKNVSELFKSAMSLPPEERREKFASIKQEYQDILKKADVKVSMANSMFDIVEKYQRKLEGEVQKFKLELEADSPGITSQLEQKVRDAEARAKQQKRELRRKQRRAMEARLGRIMAERTSSSDSPIAEHLIHRTLPHPPDPTFHRPIGIPGRPPNSAAALLARRAQSHPNRLSEIKALNAAGIPGTSGYSIGGNMGGGGGGMVRLVEHNRPQVPTASLLTALERQESRHGRPRKMTTKVQEMLKESMHRERTRLDSSTGTGGSGEEDADQGEEATDETPDTDQRRWCICNKPSHGEMVACDSEKCPFEWFHYGCVGIDKAPKGKWFCPHCIRYPNK